MSSATAGDLCADVYQLSMGRFEELTDLVDELIFPVRWQAAKDVRSRPVEFINVRLGALTISAANVPGEVSATAVERGAYHVVMVEAGSLRSEHRATRVRVSPHLAAIYPPSGPAVATWTGPQDHPLSVKVDAPVLEEQLAAHLGHPVAHPIRLADSMTLAVGPGHTWASLVRLIYHDALDGWPLGQHPLIASRLHDSAVHGLLIAAEHPHRQELLTPASAMRPRPVKRAIDVIEAYPDRPLPITTVARMVGVSTRTLQDGFRRHVGVTPTAYARQVRLARAHDDLREADPHQDTVASIAHRWGFAHLGRFAATYRDTYGATPSETLRRNAI